MFYAPATRATLLESFNRNFSHFPPVLGEIRPARRGSSIHWHRFRCAGGGRAGVGGGEGISPASPFLLSLSIVLFTRRRRGWRIGSGVDCGPVCFCSLLFPTVMGRRRGQGKIPTPPAFTADISLPHRRPSSPPSNAATAIIIPAATLHYHYRG